MSKEALIAGHELKKAFLTEAIQEGVYLIRPKNTSPDQWSKQRKIGFRYAFQEDITLEELGRDYGGTREDIRRLNHKFLNTIHGNSPPELQAQYPREAIPDRKPLGPQPRERISKRLCGLSLRVRDAIQQQNITDPNQIKNILNISTEQLALARRTLRGWGVDVPRTVRLDKETFAEQVENENDDEKLQKLLDGFSTNSLRGFLERDSSHETLSTLSAIVNEKGFRVHTNSVRFIAETIKEAKIPIRKIEYFDKKGKLLSSRYVVFTKHGDRIAEVVDNNPTLQRSR